MNTRMISAAIAVVVVSVTHMACAACPIAHYGKITPKGEKR